MIQPSKEFILLQHDKLSTEQQIEHIHTILDNLSPSLKHEITFTVKLIRNN